MKVRAGKLLATCLFTAVALAGAASAEPPDGKGGGKTDDGGRGVAVEGTFTDDVGLKIYNDVLLPYTPSGGNGDIFGEIRNDTGELRFSVSEKSGRRVHLSLDEPIRVVPIDEAGTVECIVVNDPQNSFRVSAPPSLLGGFETQTTFFRFYTGPRVVLSAGEPLLLETLDLLAMAPGEESLVQMMIFFWEEGYDRKDSVYVRFNETGLIGGGWIAGIGKVRAHGDEIDGAVDSWVLSPADLGVFTIGHASLGNTRDNGAKGRNTLWGACDFGDFNLDFEFTVSRL